MTDRIRGGWERFGALAGAAGRVGPGRRAPRIRYEGPLAGLSIAGRSYFQRWLLIGVLIGVVAGVGSIVFFWGIALCTNLLLGHIAGFYPPGPAGEGATVVRPIARPWLIPVVTTLGGLLCGLIVYTLAPEAEGHGTDAAIDAFHERGGKIRARIPPVKLLASAITIGSGGSAGREGPTAQIAAGFGSWLGDLLHLDDHDRRIAMAAGVGAGIGSIFKAPFGGALLSGEILYKRDFEAEALFPAFIASVVGFSIYGAWAGWTPLFGRGGHFSFTHPLSLLGFLVLGLCCGLAGLLYPTALYGVRGLFRRIRVPDVVKPAIGGLLVGLVGLALPQALGMGYGFAQFAIDGNFVAISAWLMLALVFVKIATTALTIGSGGSGGVFGPGMVIGGFLGGALWSGLHAWAPWILGATPPGAFAVVGMGAFFGGIAKAPLAVILMVAEMTGEYSLIVPAMLATMVAYLVTGDTSIYESQVPTRLDSPAHKDDYALPLLQSLRVAQAMGTGRATAGPDATVAALAALLREHRVASVPIVEAGRLVGLVTATDLARVPPADAEITRARQIMSRRMVRALPDESLYRAWLRMARRGFRQLAVVDPADPDRLLGVVTYDAIGRLLRQPMLATLPPGASGASNPLPPGARTGETAPGGALAGGFALMRPAPADARAAAAPSAATPAPAGDAAGRTVPMAGPAGGRPQALLEGDENDETDDNEEDEATRERPGRASSSPLEESALRGAVAAPAGGDPLARLAVADAMLRTPRLVAEAEPLTRVIALLDERGRALMVVNVTGELVGIVTSTDLAGRRAEEGGRALAAGDVAVRRLVTARPDETLRAAARRMSRLGLRQLPVVSAGSNRPVGLLRRSDLLEAYSRALGEGPSGSMAAAGGQPRGRE
jgi:CIC family chloride channel protein